MAQGYAYGIAVGRVDENNSTNVVLTSGSTFIGTATEITSYGSVVVSCYTDKTGTMLVQFSTDSTNWDSTISFSIEANTNEVHRLTVSKKYYRITFTNTATSTQTFLRLQSLLGSQPQLTSTLSSIVQQDADALIVRSIDSEIDIANGKYAGYSIVNKAGINTDVDQGTLPEDIWDVGGVYTGFPNNAGETITVVSTSTNDTNGGSGAWTIRITGLDANYNVQTETFTLNGTTPVTGVLIFTRVHTAQVVTSGSGNTVFNAGTITVRHTTTTANVFLQIRIGTNQSNCSAYTVPSGYTAYMRNITVEILSSSATTAAADFSVWTQPSLKTASPRLRRPAAAYYGGASVDNIYGGLVFAEKTDMILRVTSVSATNNTSVAGGYDLLLVKN